ncbi:MAG: hypothetical protein AB7P99_19380, partial [Vicinamibacterales bacterium]
MHVAVVVVHASAADQQSSRICHHPHPSVGFTRRAHRAIIAAAGRCRNATNERRPRRRRRREWPMTEFLTDAEIAALDGAETVPFASPIPV